MGILDLIRKQEATAYIQHTGNNSHALREILTAPFTNCMHIDVQRKAETGR